MKKFYLGMDIGTESVGMACTDEQYNLLRAKGKDLWAVRLFDEAKDAKERRTKRTARRRLQRRRQRIEWLQAIFAPFMEDDRFFLRLNNSGFYEDFIDEIERNNDDGILPVGDSDIEPISLKVTSSAYVVSTNGGTDEDTAMYQINLKFIYLKKRG